jgi:hypothetical protein
MGLLNHEVLCTSKNTKTNKKIQNIEMLMYKTYHTESRLSSFSVIEVRFYTSP